jgi:Peroxisomal membrane anchor protein (Pex14p) conserved region.
MADDGETPTQPGTSDPTQNNTTTTQPHNTSTSQIPASSWPNSATSDHNRSELVARARSFLTSPHIQPQDIFAKRRFLADKGLSETEIEGLLNELVHEISMITTKGDTDAKTQPLQLPAVPPRTYPQPPPSNLPNLIVGLARLFSWIAGGSAALIFIYYVRPFTVVIF